MAIDVGARLVACDADGRITRLEPAGQEIARAWDCQLEVGGTVSEAELRRWRAYMVDELLGEVSVGGTSLGSAPVAHRATARPLAASPRSRSRVAFRSSSTVALRAPSAISGALLAEELRRRAGRPRARQSSMPRAASAPPSSAPRSTPSRSPADHLSVAARRRAGPQHPGRHARFPVARGRFRDADRHRRHPGCAAPLRPRRQPTRPSRSPRDGKARPPTARIKAFCAGAVEALGSTLPTAIRSSWSSTATSAACWACTSAKRCSWTLPIISIDGLELREFDFIDIGKLIPDVRRRAGGHQVAGLPDLSARASNAQRPSALFCPRNDTSPC